jgi:hypothetical protein
LHSVQSGEIGVPFPLRIDNPFALCRSIHSRCYLQLQPAN